VSSRQWKPRFCSLQNTALVCREQVLSLQLQEISLGLLSVLTKATMHEFGARGFGGFATLAPWSLAFVGVLGLLLQQSAHRSGPLAVSLPLIDVGEPLVASAIAVMAFGEQLGRLDIAISTGLAFPGAVVATGVVLLDHSPLVQAAQAGLSLETGARRTAASNFLGTPT
jgi:hypothetical protein